MKLISEDIKERKDFGEDVVILAGVVKNDEDERLLEEFDELNDKIDAILLSGYHAKGIENLTEEESEQYDRIKNSGEGWLRLRTLIREIYQEYWPNVTNFEVDLTFVVDKMIEDEDKEIEYNKYDY